MTLSIHNTHDWPQGRVFAYGPDITAAMWKLVEQFPKDISVKSLADDVFSGKQQLWLILDGEKFVSFVLTEIKTNDVTGIKSVQITALAGSDGVASVPLIAKIEEWARSIEADEVSVLGRAGWKKALVSEGYAMNAVLFRKDLN